jgi:hypothetical protein
MRNTVYNDNEYTYISSHSVAFGWPDRVLKENPGWILPGPRDSIYVLEKMVVLFALITTALAAVLVSTKDMHTLAHR